MSAEYVDDRMAEQLMWQDECPVPMSVLEAEIERAERKAASGSAPSGEGHTASEPVVAPASRWPSLLMVLLARLRGEQPFENCFMCLTSDDPKDVCAEHLDRLDRIVNYRAVA